MYICDKIWKPFSPQWLGQFQTLRMASILGWFVQIKGLVFFQGEIRNEIMKIHSENPSKGDKAFPLLINELNIWYNYSFAKKCLLIGTAVNQMSDVIHEPLLPFWISARFCFVFCMLYFSLSSLYIHILKNTL